MTPSLFFLVRRTYSGKRAFDLVVVFLVAVPALVLGLFCAAAIQTSSRGPVFFRQERLGRNGDKFSIWKFRTMRGGPGSDDDRVTTVGRMLRRTSLDELPQLMNIVNGEMSVVGPRPTLPEQADRWTNRQRCRLAERPGLTGLAQVNGRNDLSWPERIEFDLRYVEEQSLWLDLRIVVRTASTLVGGEGTQFTAANDPIAHALSPQPMRTAA